jgi:tRNA threonylcarbamoyladenosine biosynthesis protein TsaB
VNIVAIETATETVGVAVRAESGAEAAFTLRGRRRHVETLAPAMAHLFDQVGLAPTDLAVVAVDLGPGLFTGLRVGVAAAKGLAQAVGIGVLGLTSLDILTQASAEIGHTGLVMAAVDARRGEVFACVRELHADGAPAEDVIGGGLFSPEELAVAVSGLGGVRIVGVGDGAQRYAGVLDEVPGVSCLMGALGSPPPSTLLAMAADLYDAGRVPVAPHLVVPLYMRAADATSNFAQVTST